MRFVSLPTYRISDILASCRAAPTTFGDFGEDMDLAVNPVLTMPNFGEDMDLAANPVLICKSA